MGPHDAGAGGIERSGVASQVPLKAGVLVQSWPQGLGLRDWTGAGLKGWTEAGLRGLDSELRGPCSGPSGSCQFTSATGHSGTGGVSSGPLSVPASALMLKYWGAGTAWEGRGSTKHLALSTEHQALPPGQRAKCFTVAEP